MIGRIRLQWWRECLDGIYDGAARQHEVVQPLAEAIAARQLPRALLEAIIDARELDLDAEPPASLEALRGYVEGTSTSLVRLALHVLGAAAPPLRAAAGPPAPPRAHPGLSTVRSPVGNKG